MKKVVVILSVILVVLLAAALWEPVMDALPIDQSHWVGKDDIMYHVGPKGDLDMGWYEEGGHRYYLDPNKGGAMATGWTEIEGEPYCFTSAGLLITGWYEEAGKYYYFGEDGIMASGWTVIEKERHYLDEITGAAVSGWQEIGGARCYLDAKGGVCTGWQEIGGSRYYLTDQGTVYTGWLEIEDERYYLAEDGTVTTGWMELEGQRYYFLESGAAAKGRHEIDGRTFYFTSTGANIILVNRWNYLPEDYEPSIVHVLNVRVDESCADALVEMAEACEAAGHGLWIRSSYRTNGDQTYLLQNKVDRLMATGLDHDAAYAKAIQSVAVPGTSEHQLGLAVDIVDADYTALNQQQSQTDTQKWLMEHCWEYGFILRYPDGTTESTGIIYEPWHYRYVGRELALELRDLGICLEDYLDMLNEDAESCGGKGQ